MSYEILSLAPVFVAALAGLAWVGWRYFYVRESYVRRADALTGSGGVSPVVSSLRLECPRSIRIAYVGWLLLVAVVVGLAVLGTWRVAGYHTLTPISSTSLDYREQLHRAFETEILAPPPALPPATFVSSGWSSLAEADRDWSKIDPKFSLQVLRLISRLGSQGYAFVLVEGYRSPARQDSLAGGELRVTLAGAYQSRHQFGLAVDLAPIREGKIVMSEQDPWALEAYRALGREADAAGLVWGGHWSLRDYGHIEIAGHAGH